MVKDTVIIGGGAAGMMAAITAAERGRSVTLVEHNDFCGKKLRITGKGRCNVCNDCDVKTFLQNVPRNPKFLYGALSRFTPADTMAFFAENGVPLKTERGRRVFPVSGKAHDIANALEKRMKRAGVSVLISDVKAVLAENGAVRGVKTAEGEIPCESVLIATGGLSYPLTGSTGDGFRFARSLGHTIVEPRPSLVPLESGDPDCGELQGLSLKNVRLTALDSRGQTVYTELGELLFTHFGVSGPLVLSASAHMRDFSRGERYCFALDLKPGLDDERLDARVLRDFEKYKNRDLGNALGDLLPRKLIPVLLRRCTIPPETKVHSVTREQRLRLVQTMKAFQIPVLGPRPIAEAVITSGGVDVGELDPRTMQSKLVRGLYFAGEVIDVDAFTGGYNLQIAWSTGRLAGTQL